MKTLEKTVQRERKAASRRAFDAQAPRYDDAVCGEHARALYPHVLHALQDAYMVYARGEEAAGRARAGVPAAPFRVLDLGCGTGALDELVLSSLPSVRLTGVDIAPEMLVRARRRLQGHAVFVPGDAEKLPFEDGGFDAVICNDAFHHFPDPRHAAFEAWRVLAPGGTLILGDSYQMEPIRVVVNFALPFSREGDVRIYSEGELRRILGAWFSTVEWRQVAPTACLAQAHK